MPSRSQVAGGADVDDQGTSVERREGIVRLESADPCSRSLEQFVERASALRSAHPLIIRWTLHAVHGLCVGHRSFEADELPEPTRFPRGNLEAA